MRLNFKNRYIISCVRDGREVWHEDIFNLVTDEGLQHVMDVYFTQTALAGQVYVGLKGDGTPFASDTLANHPSWAEVNPYVGSRQLFQGAPITVPGLSNTATPTVYDITQIDTVAGIFLATVDSGVSGKLWSVADFVDPRAVKPGDKLTMTITLQARSA